VNLYQIMTAEQAALTCEIAKGLDWEVGQARTEALTGTVKQNNEVLTHPELISIGKLLLANRGVLLHEIPLKAHPPKFSRYKDGQHYKMHTDAPWMLETRTDMSCTIWLNDDYEGGELVIGDKKVKGKPGMAAVYPCGEPHEVLPVTSGERICAITWIQSRIRDPIKRKWLSDMRKFIAKFEDNEELMLEGSRLNSAMLRRWSE
jgi:PKHD-type hydroxylase